MDEKKHENIEMCIKTPPIVNYEVLFIEVKCEKRKDLNITELLNIN